VSSYFFWGGGEKTALMAASMTKLGSGGHGSDFERETDVRNEGQKEGCLSDKIPTQRGNTGKGQKQQSGLGAEGGKGEGEDQIRLCVHCAGKKRRGCGCVV